MNIKRLLYSLIVLYSFFGCGDDDFDDYNIPPKMYSSEHFEQYLLQNFDKDGDGHISIREAKNVKEIEYLNENRWAEISLSCLQYFTELEILHCSNTIILDIDLTKCSKLKALTCSNIGYYNSTIDLSKNAALEVLEFTSGGGVQNLNLSNNVNLKKLLLNNFDEIETLDLSENRKLEDLSLTNCSSGSISLKNNPELKKLCMCNIYNANLDFSNNTKLESLYLSDLYSDDDNRIISIENSSIKSLHCSLVDGLKSIDLSGCSKLDSLYIETPQYKTSSIKVNFEDCYLLKYLSLINGEYTFTGTNSFIKMEEINLRGNINLKEFDFSSMTELKKLHFSDINSTNAVSINLSGNRSLEEIYFRNIENINSIKISGCENLLRVECDYLYNGDNEVQVSIDNCYSLECLSLLGNSYSIPDISQCVKLKVIRLESVDLDISKNTELEHVYLGSGYLLSPITKNKKIKTLNCISVKNAEIFDLSNQLLLEELFCHNIIPINIEHNKALKILNIAEMYYDNTNVGKTSFSLKDYPHLSEVRFIPYGKMSSMEIEDCPSLKELYIVHHYSIDTLKITNCETLQRLTCNDLDIKALDVRTCPNLEVLWCWYNDISELNLSGAPRLKQLVCSFNRIEKLDVRKNIALAELNCEYNEPMAELDLRNNKNLKNFSCGNDKNPITVYLFKDYSQNKYVINGTIVYE